MDTNELELYKRILNDISGGIIYLKGGTIDYLNEAALEILNKSESDLKGRSFVENFMQYEENDDFNQVIFDAFYDEDKHENVVQYFDGLNTKYLHIKTSMLQDKLKKGVIVLFDDITELMKLRGVSLDLEKIKEINKQLEIHNRQLKMSRDVYKKASETDKMTKLLNKAAMERLCSEYLSKLGMKERAVLFIIDLDHFKEANDTYGHKCGDKILQQFAKSLKEIFRLTDYIGRFGGDEFVVMLKQLQMKTSISRKAEKILNAARNIHIEGKKIRITASIGIAVAPEHGKSYAEIFDAADKSMYEVKHRGRNGFKIAEDMNNKSE